MAPKIILVLSFLALSPLCALDPYQDLFVKANEAYQRNNYPEAIKLYQQSLDSTQSFEQHLNLAHAYFASQSYSHALLHYLKAQILNPSAPELPLCLQKTYEHLNLLPPNTSFFSKLPFFFTSNTWSILFSLSFWSSIALLLLKPFLQLNRRLAFSLLSISLVILALSSFSCLYYHKYASSGLTLSPHAPLKVSPDPLSPLIATLPEGSQASILKSFQDYYFVSTPSNQQGWIHNKNFQPIWDSPTKNAP